MNWIVKQYLDNFRDDSTWPKFAFREQIRRYYNITISRDNAYRARKLALKMVYENESEHYQNSQDYAAAVHKWNPSSICGLVKGEPYFHKMFEC